MNKNINELNALAEEYLNNHNLESKKFKIVRSIRYNDYDDIHMKKSENVYFDCNSHGMLGGQYWGLLYIPQNKYLDETYLYVYNEREIKGTGNNIFISKKINIFF